VEKARAGKLSAEERSHPTFTISSLGMFQVEQFEAVINPPSSVTMAVASARPEPVARKGGIAIADIMRVTLSCDHRIIDGATAARFLAELKSFLEDDKSFLVKA
jgi:pyruvate dehydrogenase E2 component (dihydrolipoamide acetyltransferase)